MDVSQQGPCLGFRAIPRNTIPHARTPSEQVLPFARDVRVSLLLDSPKCRQGPSRVLQVQEDPKTRFGHLPAASGSLSQLRRPGALPLRHRPGLARGAERAGAGDPGGPGGPARVGGGLRPLLCVFFFFGPQNFGLLLLDVAIFGQIGSGTHLQEDSQPPSRMEMTSTLLDHLCVESEVLELHEDEALGGAGGDPDVRRPLAALRQRHVREEHGASDAAEKGRKKGPASWFLWMALCFSLFLCAGVGLSLFDGFVLLSRRRCMFVSFLFPGFVVLAWPFEQGMVVEKRVAGPSETLDTGSIKQWPTEVDFCCECVPMMVFMVCFFGFMDYMVLFKWVTPMPNPPSIINSMIAARRDFFQLGAGETDPRASALVLKQTPWGVNATQLWS